MGRGGRGGEGEALEDVVDVGPVAFDVAGVVEGEGFIGEDSRVHCQGIMSGRPWGP